MSGPALTMIPSAITTLRRYPWVAVFVLALALVFVAASDASGRRDLKEQLGTKADTSAISSQLRSLRTQIDGLQVTVDSQGVRQRQFFCFSKPSFCR